MSFFCDIFLLLSVLCTFLSIGSFFLYENSLSCTLVPTKKCFAACYRVSGFDESYA